jgi:uncharacterized membrane protein YGL010W
MIRVPSGLVFSPLSFLFFLLFLMFSTRRSGYLFLTKVLLTNSTSHSFATLRVECVLARCNYVFIIPFLTGFGWLESYCKYKPESVFLLYTSVVIFPLDLITLTSRNSKMPSFSVYIVNLICGDCWFRSKKSVTGHASSGHS